MMVNKDRVRMLIAGLRSGAYEKGIGELHRLREWNQDDPAPESWKEVSTWCCLGVAGDIAEKNGCQVRRGVSFHGLNETFGGDTAFMPVQVYDWYGFPGANPYLQVPPGILVKADPKNQHPAFTASYLNDAFTLRDTPGDLWRGLAFGEIADCFEYTFLGES